MDNLQYLPSHGADWDDLKATMKDLSQDDLEWRKARHAAYVWYANEDVELVARKAYVMFMHENGLSTTAFPSLGRMESEVVSIVAELLNGNHEVAGHMTSGGTESIFLAVKAARDWASEHYPYIKNPNVVTSFSAHPALNKAAHYLGVKVIRVPTRDDFRADVQALNNAVNQNTIMIYGSAPTYSIGVIDPIEEMASLARERHLWFHVDACVGGILGPFVRLLGYPVPHFGFECPGVTSISADLHKSGFSAKGASTILFKNKKYESYCRFLFDDWPSGRYNSATFPGTRPGGAIAAAWAVMNHLGKDGYVKIAEQVMDARKYFIEGIESMDGLRMLGEPDLWAVAFATHKGDISNIINFMTDGGWRVSPVKNPPGIHLMITPIHIRFISEYLHDLQQAINKSHEDKKTNNTYEIEY